jgi:DNA-binding YbaB/EbfC family protein
LSLKNLKEMQQIEKQIWQMLKQLRKQLDGVVGEASAGAGMFSVAMNGNKYVTSVHIDPEVFASKDIELLQDLAQAALNEARRKVDEELASRIASLTGGLNIPCLTGDEGLLPDRTAPAPAEGDYTPSYAEPKPSKKRRINKWRRRVQRMAPEPAPVAEPDRVSDVLPMDEA